MKKIFFYIFLTGSIYALLFFQVFWNTCDISSCKVADAPSPLLTQYLENLSEISNSLIEKLSEAEAKIDEAVDTNTAEEKRNPIWIEIDAKNTKNRVLAAFNSILSFRAHYGSFDFWVSSAMTNEVPKVVKRDHDSLEGETEKLTSLLKKSAHRGSISLKIENICEAVENCNIPDGNAWDILALLINNNKLITQLYQASVLEKPGLEPTENIILVADGFRTEIKSYYNKDTLTECSRCEGESLANFREKIQNISFKNDEYKEGVAKWKAAWAMLRWGNTGVSQAQETALLEEYLAWQWISPTQSETVVWNLERYNESWLSSSDPLTNSTNYTQANIKSEVQTFQQAMLEQFEGEEKVPFVRLGQVNTEIKTTENFKKEIHSLFEEQKPFAFSQDVASQQLQLRILRMHFSLIRSINILEGNRETAMDVCETPGWWGKCRNY